MLQNERSPRFFQMIDNQKMNNTMKRNLIVVAMTAVLCMFAACTPQSTPRQVVKTYWTAVQNENYSAAVDLYYNIDGLFSEDSKELIATLMKVEMEAYGKITEVKVLSVDKTEKDKAVVAVELTTENRPDPFVETMDVVKSNGKWYIDFEI